MGSVRWSIYIINSVDKRNFRVSLPHRRSTTVSSETNPLYSGNNTWHCVVPGNIHTTVLSHGRSLEILKGNGVSKPKLCYSSNRVRQVTNSYLQATVKTACTLLHVVWFQKISIPPPRRELEIPEGWGVQKPRKFQRGGANGQLTSRWFSWTQDWPSC